MNNMESELAAEMSCLGSMMIDQANVAKAMAVLSADDFAWPSHRALFTVVCQMHAKGTPADLVTLPNELDARGMTELTGGVAYLIQVIESVPSAHNGEYYAETVRQLGIVRKLKELGTFSVETATDEDLTPDDKLAMVRDRLSQIGIKSGRIYDLAEIDADKAPDGVPSGLKFVNQNTESCGWPKGQLSVIAARKKVGKTSALVQASLCAALANRSVLYVTLTDLTRDQIKRRMVRQFTGWGKRPDSPQRAAEFDAMLTQFQAYDLRVAVADTPSIGSRQIEDVCAYVESHHAGRKFDLVCVDYFQKMSSRKERDKVRALGIVSDGLANLAERTGSAVLVGSQTSKDGMTAWSQALEDDCGVLLELEKPDEFGDRIEASLKYNRWGPAGSFEMVFDTEKLRFTEKP